MYDLLAQYERENLNPVSYCGGVVRIPILDGVVTGQLNVYRKKKLIESACFYNGVLEGPAFTDFGIVIWHLNYRAGLLHGLQEKTRGSELLEHAIYLHGHCLWSSNPKTHTRVDIFGPGLPDLLWAVPQADPGF